MLAITTKVLPATNTRGARLVALARYGSGYSRRLITAWDYELNVGENHENAAHNLLGRYTLAPHGLRSVGSGETAPGVRVHLFAALSLDAPLPLDAAIDRFSAYPRKFDLQAAIARSL